MEHEPVPWLLVLDELTANLSEVSRSVILETLIEQLASRSLGVLYFAHFGAEARRLSDRIYRMTPNGLEPEGISQ